ncbi:MAG: hypothetical protein PHC39_05005 [Proteiniphilum sp.]|nr:hypothetical protein [Proteiniphilum sp.]
MAKDEVKRGRGGPKKVRETEKPANPDCEPATKGFVKCIARTLVDKQSSHFYYENRDSDCGGMFSFAVGTFAFFVWGFAMSVDNVPMVAWASGVIVIMCIVGIAEMYINKPNIRLNTRDYCKAIQKYEPPTCEKKECE